MKNITLKTDGLMNSQNEFSEDGVFMEQYETVKKIEETVNSFFVGKQEVVRDVLICLLTGGHVLLADEINRTSPKTQASLLEAMSENQVTVDGTVYPLEQPFMVIATQNPVEYIGTYPLPEAQMDRFMMKLSIGYPDRKQEMEMVSQLLEGKAVEQIRPVCDGKCIEEIKKLVSRIHVEESVIEYIEDIIGLTRQENRFEAGASPRAMIALVKASQARAFLEGRDYVKPDDVKAVAMQVLLHRLSLSSEARIRKEDGAKILQSLILKASIPV